jgi:hypothetical protein
VDARAGVAGLLGAVVLAALRGSFSADGDTIEGAWHASHDEGATWEKDFGIVYRRIR